MSRQHTLRNQWGQPAFSHQQCWECFFFTATLVTILVDETNAYAREVLGDSAGTDVTCDDIWVFLGFALLMRMNRLPQLQLYWNRQPAFHYLPVAQQITKDRFMAIGRYLHFTPKPPSSPPYTAVGASPTTVAGASSSPSHRTRTQDK